MKASSIWPVTIVVFLLLCVALATGCARSPAAAPAAQSATVTVSYPIERNVTDYADFTGRTAAVHSVEVRARVDGYLDSVNFKEGALVKKGDVLFVIDPRPFVAELNRAKAQLEEAEGQLHASRRHNSTKQKPRRVARLPVSTMHAGDWSARRSLLPGDVITQEEFDLQESELLQAEADLQRAKAGIASSQAAIGIGEGRGAIRTGCRGTRRVEFAIHAGHRAHRRANQPGTGDDRQPGSGGTERRRHAADDDRVRRSDVRLFRHRRGHRSRNSPLDPRGKGPIGPRRRVARAAGPGE